MRPDEIDALLQATFADGKMTRQDSLDSGLRVPMWVIGTF